MRSAGVCSEGEGGLFVVGDEVVGGERDCGGWRQERGDVGNDAKTTPSA